MPFARPKAPPSRHAASVTNAVAAALVQCHKCFHVQQPEPANPGLPASSTIRLRGINNITKFFLFIYSI
jgi:hypothetical protein